MQYRRVKIKGACYFFTVNLADRKSSLLIDQIDLLRHVVNAVKKRHPFILDAMVVLPDHLHAMMTLPENDDDYAKRWMLIKSKFSRQIPKTENIYSSRKSKRERGIWQRRYWEHLIRDDEDYKNHVHYIHYNPVKHGYVNKPVDWAYSTIHQYIHNGLISEAWACNKQFTNNTMGESRIR
jgi:putative transposase